MVQANADWADCRSDADSELTYTSRMLCHTSGPPYLTPTQNAASLISAGILKQKHQ